MIIEIKMQLNETKILFGAWEFNDSIWEYKKNKVKDFMHQIAKTQTVSFALATMKDRIIYEIEGKPYAFYLIQDALNDYIKTLDGKQLVG